MTLLRCAAFGADWPALGGVIELDSQRALSRWWRVKHIAAWSNCAFLKAAVFRARVPFWDV